MIKKLIYLLFLLISLSIKSQTNIFLKRNYWKSNPSIEDIDLRIKEGYDITALNPNAFDPVVYALLEKVDNETILYLLSKKGNGANKLTHDGRTYIFWSAYKANLDIMKHLVKIGAKTDLQDDKGYSIFNFVASTGSQDKSIYNYLISLGSKPNIEKDRYGANASLLIAPYVKDTSFIDYFTSLGINISTTDNEGNNMINYAARGGNKEIINYLIDKDLSYNIPNKNGGNAFIFASKGTKNHRNSLEFYQYLEELGINPNVINKDGINVLHYLSYRNKNKTIFNYFIDKGVSVNQADKHGNTPFINAASSNNLDVVSYLYKNVKNINFANKDGQSALSKSIQGNQPDVVNFLLENKADVNIIDKRGKNLSYYLITSFNSKKIDEFKNKIKLVEDYGFNIKETQGNGDTLYHLAIDKNSIELLQWIQSLNININAKNKDGYTALHKAIMTASDDKIIKFLIKYGADKTIKTDFGESVYDLAKENELLQKNKINIKFLK